MKTAYILCSKHTGNNNQLIALASQFPGIGDVIKINCDCRTRARLLRPLYKAAIALKRKTSRWLWLSQWIDRLFLNAPPKTLNSDSIIFAKTTPFEIPAALLASGQQCMTIYIGEPKRVQSHYFSLILSTPSTPYSLADVTLDVLPSESTYHQFKVLKEKNNSKQTILTQKTQIWSLLLGGNATHYTYTKESIKKLVHAIITLAEQHHIRWIISTSPRTGSDNEQLIQSLLANHKDVIHELVLWQQGQRKSVMEILSLSDLAVISEESVSMLSETINARIPIVAIRPLVEQQYNTLVTPFVSYHEKNNHLKRMVIGSLEYSAIQLWLGNHFQAVEQCWSEQLNQQLQPPSINPKKIS